MSNSPLVTYTNLSPNKTSPRNHVIDTITIHCIVGQWTAKQGCDYFSKSSIKASPNYVVGKDGSIGLCVEEKDRSWCTGATNPIYINGISGAQNDHRAITIEVASDISHPYAVTNAAYEALINLLVDICQRNNIKQLLWKNDKTLVGQTDKQNMTAHRWFANKTCPGDYLYNRFGDIAEKVNQKLFEMEDEDMTQETFNKLMNNYLAELAQEPTTWEQTDADWGQQNGLLNGDEHGNIMAKKFITRGEMIAVLHRFAQKFIK